MEFELGDYWSCDGIKVTLATIVIKIRFLLLHSLQPSCAEAAQGFFPEYSSLECGGRGLEVVNVAHFLASFSVES